jgi:hypothetical protein
MVGPRYRPQIGEVWEVVYYASYVPYSVSNQLDTFQRQVLPVGTKIILGHSDGQVREILVGGVRGGISTYDLRHSCRPCPTDD